MQVCANRFLGYDKDEDGNLVINPEEAEVVRRIYREYLSGQSYYAIGQGLTADSIRTAAGNVFWLASTLKKILTKPRILELIQELCFTPYSHNEGMKGVKRGEPFRGVKKAAPAAGC